MSVPQNGPATTWASSSTRIPSRGRRVSVMSMSPSGSVSSIPWAIVGGSPRVWRRTRRPWRLSASGRGPRDSLPRRRAPRGRRDDRMIEPDRYYMRNPEMVAMGTAAHYLFVRGDGSLVEVPTSRPAQCLGLMQLLMAPTLGATLRAHLVGTDAIDSVDLFGLRQQGCLLEASTIAALEAQR